MNFTYIYFLAHWFNIHVAMLTNQIQVAVDLKRFERGIDLHWVCTYDRCMYGVKQQDLHKFITDNNLNLNTLQENSLAPPELYQSSY